MAEWPRQARLGSPWQLTNIVAPGVRAGTVAMTAPGGVSAVADTAAPGAAAAAAAVTAAEMPWPGKATKEHCMTMPVLRYVAAGVARPARSTFQTTTTPELSDETRREPSGLQASMRTSPRWAVRSSLRAWSVMRTVTTVPFARPIARIGLMGCHADDVTSAATRRGARRSSPWS